MYCPKIVNRWLKFKILYPYFHNNLTKPINWSIPNAGDSYPDFN